MECNLMSPTRPRDLNFCTLALSKDGYGSISFASVRGMQFTQSTCEIIEGQDDGSHLVCKCVHTRTTMAKVTDHKRTIN
eukprot:6220227-Amphidinium_carterae.1